MSDWYLFRSAMRDMLRLKRLVVAAVLIGLPSLIALLFRLRVAKGFYRADEVYASLSSGIVFSFILVLLAVVFATGALSEEIEQKTIVYLLTRPVPRWRILLVKFSAALVAIVVTVCLASVLLAFTTFSFGGSASRSPLLVNSDVRDVQSLVARLKAEKDPLSEYLWEGALPQTRALVEPPNRINPFAMAMGAMNGQTPQVQPATPGQIRKQLVRELNDVIQDSDNPLYDPERFAKAPLSASLRAEAAGNATGQERLRINRLLLEAAYPAEIAHMQSVPKLVARDLMILPVGALAYAAVFLFFATIMKRPLIWGLVFVFGWESWTPNLPDKFQMISLMSYLRALAPHDKPDAESVDLSQVFSSTGGGEIISNTVAWAVLAGVVIVFLFLALSAFSNREYVPREDAE